MRVPCIAGAVMLLCMAEYLVALEQSMVIEKLDNVNSDILSRQKRSLSSTGIKSLRVTSVIQSRFARVTFVSTMENGENFAKEMTFSVRLPKAAFITEFNMVVDGVTFIGKIKEKEAAKKQFEQAKESGNTAGLVTADVRETRTFDVSANVPAHSSVDFHLVYQQLLKRKLGSYNHVIMVNPGQVIDNFVIDVYITETSGITSISTETPGKGSGAREKVAKSDDDKNRIDVYTDVRRSKNQAKVTFKPTQTQQRRLLTLPEDEKKFTVNYDVTREVLGGEIQTRNGYFVHFFAPENLPILAKKVVFLIDQSGSMQGHKMQQTKTAFASILKELRDSDRFNIISFSTGTETWKNTEDGLVGVTNKNVDEAVKHVQNLNAAGGTNINEAILKASRLFQNDAMDEPSSSMIILLSDGNPTSGVSNTAQIRLNARREINGRFSLFCLGFGEDIDHDFLKRLSNENDGIARKIYEDSDADIQLEGFFQEVAAPLLLNVKMRYSGADADAVSISDFDKYFKGSEEVIVGVIDESAMGVHSVISGMSREGEVRYEISSTEIDDSFQHWYKDAGNFDDFIERLWAYFTIENLLEKKTLSESQIKKQELTSKIIELALKYKFVTPLTSMVVTLPEDEIKTTPDGPIVEPTLPPCIMRGSKVPEDITEFPIWCPVIFDRQTSRVVPNRGRYLSRTLSHTHSSITRLLSSAPKLARMRTASNARVIGAGHSFRSSSITNRRQRISSLQQIMGQRTSLATSFTTTTTTTRIPTTATPPPRKKTPRFLRTCSGKKRTSSGRITLSTLIQSEPYPYTCKWIVKVKKGSWIDLHAETLNTTKNQVVVTGADGQNILLHQRGFQSPKFISVEDNKITILIAIHPSDKLRPGIEISYEEFIPEPDTPAVVHEIEFPQESTPNCGNIINSAENPEGTISSPGFPKMYLDNLYCQWSILNSNATTHDLIISFQKFDVETNAGGPCTHDILAVGEGDEEQTFCGHDLPEDITTGAELVKIKFMSDDSLGAGGFMLRYDLVAK
uniref:inter-alpha-trypsin inhibitor heavy chain H4-like n=1 Tax=Styela clava TaxID=7725 RepID=UPI001939A67A|nr:inter-alpha-trypsin inhibitor heavy chain H4-like [Styela clava]